MSVTAASLANIVFEQARAHGSLEALRVESRSLTYDELNARALAVAAGLIESGIARETVAIVGQRKVSSYVGLLGILYAGCSYVPVNPKYSSARLLAILKDANVRGLVGDREDLERLDAAIAGTDVPPMIATLIPEGQAPAGRSWRDERSLSRLRPLEAPVESDPDALAYLLFTSGSTGWPKGVQVTNRNVLAFLRSMAALYPLEPGFRASQTFDFSFDPSVSDMFFTWSRAGILCVLPEEELLLPHEYIRREGITFWNSVPAIAGFMGRMRHLTPGIFPDLKHSMFCGEQFPQAVADAWRRAAPNSTVENLYGPTEATIYISRYLYSAEDAAKSFRNGIVPIGHSFLDHEAALIDDDGSRVPHGEVGEIVFRGPQITRGYLHDPVKTAAAFVTFSWDSSGSTWYRTGDLGFVNDDGLLECIGRRDNQIKLGGRRIEIGEIEAVLHRYPPTRDAVVVAVRDANDVVIGCVAFTTRSLARDEEAAIRQDSMQFLERLFFPRWIVTIDAIPLSASGKQDRKTLATLAQQVLEAEARPVG